MKLHTSVIVPLIIIIKNVSFQLAHEGSDSDRSASPTPIPNTVDAVPLDPSLIPEMDLLNLNNSCGAPINTNSTTTPSVNLLDIDIDGDMNSSPSNFDLLSNAPLIGIFLIIYKKNSVIRFYQFF